MYDVLIKKLLDLLQTRRKISSKITTLHNHVRKISTLLCIFDGKTKKNIYTSDVLFPNEFANANFYIFRSEQFILTKLIT